MSGAASYHHVGHKAVVFFQLTITIYTCMILDETSHVLFQLTGVIRNLVNDLATQKRLGAFLCISMRQYCG